MGGTVEPGSATSKQNLAWEPLLDIESGFAFMYEAGITSATIIQCHDTGTVDKATKALRSQVGEVVAANPWLAGRLVWDKKRHKNLILEYPMAPGETDLAPIFVVSDAPELATLAPTQDTMGMLKALQRTEAAIGTGKSLIGKPLPVFKVTMTKSTVDKGALVVVVSLSHLVGDGHTYYQLLSMLNRDTPIRSLVVKRKMEEASDEIIRAALGPREYDHLFEPGQTVNAVWKMAFGSKSTAHMVSVDPTAVSTVKAKYTEQNPGSYISTNDLLVSSFTKGTNSRICMMAINWRGRLEGIDPDDAGNYEAVVMYDQDGADTPALIRESLTGGVPFKRTSDRPLPGFCEAIKCRYSLITNWAFPCFSGNFCLLPDVDTPTMLHMPVLNPNMMPWPYAVIFRPKKDALAVLYFLPNGIKIDDLRAAGAPLGKPVTV